MKSIISEKNILGGSFFIEGIPTFMQVSEIRKNIQKIFFDLEIIAFELVALDTRFYWENTCHSMPIC